MPTDRFPVRCAWFAAVLKQPFAAGADAADAVKMSGDGAASAMGASKPTGYAFILLLAALWAILSSTQAFAVPPGEELTFDAGPKPVIFSGQLHADHGLKCADCHTALFKKEKGNAKITLADHFAGKQYCYACHNGTKAFAPKGNCAKCHGNQSPSAAPAEPAAKGEAPPPATASAIAQEPVKAPAAAGTAKGAAHAPVPAAAAVVAPVAAPEAAKVPAPAKTESAAAKPAAAPVVAQGAANAGEATKTTEAGPTGKACEDCPDYTGWSGWAEGGANYLSDDSYHFGRYTGLEKKGATAIVNGAVRYRGKDGTYLDGKAIDLGLASRDLVVGGGNQGRYGIEVEYDQIPNFRAQDARSPFINRGGGQLGLLAVPILGTDLNSTPLKTERDRLGVKFSMIPAKEWEITGFFREEKKDGTRDVGGSFGFNQVAILPVSIDYKTDDFGVTLGYRGGKLQAQLAYAGSLFKNGQDATTWDNPFPALPNNGRIAEAPDNQFHQISGLLGYQVTDHTRIGAKVALGRMTQNQSFLPYTINPAVAANPLLSPLPASSLDGRVDTTLAKFDINSRPAPRLRLDASYTYSNRDNKSSINTYNYVIADTALAIDPNTGLPVVRQNRPYSFEQHLLRSKVDYLLPKDIGVSGGFDYDQMNRAYQQVEETKDKMLWAKIRVHPLDTLEGTLKYSYSARDASNFVPLASQNPLLENPVFPESVNPLMQAFELADRNRNKLGLDVSFTPRENLSLSLNVDYNKDNYHNMVLGLTQASGLTVTPSVTYTFSERFSATAYFTYEDLSSEQTGREWIPLPPISTIWMASDKNLTQTLGLSANWKTASKKLDLGADVVYSEFTGKIEYANAADLPDLSSKLAAIGLRGRYMLKDNLSLRAALWYEKYQESDWAKNSSINFLPTVLSLGTAAQNPETILGSLAVRYDFK
jgi:MtrB/PioB family decaheme-associated outer membrane protein